MTKMADFKVQIVWIDDKEMFEYTPLNGIAREMFEKVLDEPLPGSFYIERSDKETAKKLTYKIISNGLIINDEEETERWRKRFALDKPRITEAAPIIKEVVPFPLDDPDAARRLFLPLMGCGVLLDPPGNWLEIFKAHQKAESDRMRAETTCEPSP